MGAQNISVESQNTWYDKFHTLSLYALKSHQRMAIGNDNGKDDDASAAVPSLQRRAAVRTGFGFKRQEGEMDCVLFISKGKKGECQTPNMSGRGLCSCLKCFVNTSPAQLEMESVSSFFAKQFCTTCEVDRPTQLIQNTKYIAGQSAPPVSHNQVFPKCNFNTFTVLSHDDEL